MNKVGEYTYQDAVTFTVLTDGEDNYVIRGQDHTEAVHGTPEMKASGAENVALILTVLLWSEDMHECGMSEFSPFKLMYGAIKASPLAGFLP